MTIFGKHDKYERKQLLPIISIAHSKSIIKIMLENIQTTVARVFHSKDMVLFTSLPWFPADKFLSVLQLILSGLFISMHTVRTVILICYKSIDCSSYVSFHFYSSYYTIQTC